RREREAHEIEIQRLKDDSLKVTLSSEVSFDFDSSEIKYNFADSLNKLSSIIAKYDKTVVHVVGHTDSVGSDSYNQQLSERRARAVAEYLVSRGVDPARIHTEGRGEREPRASNETAAGRQLNRRVEIFLNPIMEGEEQKAHEPPARYY
ncbi:MAG TPA: OmpA family protein, partial [Chromatiaceae bacterium]|nr:OmpA family protein [Chromatiaceae bacterium]